VEPKDYILDRIEGEYAYLREIGADGEVFVALALLPEGADVGTKLRCEMFVYSVIE
jgi:hypothetical protein